MEFPDDLRYTENDEWVRLDGDQATLGISDYAQDQLSDVVYFEVSADVGSQVKRGEVFAVVESVKAASDVFMPVSGEIVEINDALADTPDKINTDPYGEAWMVKIRVTDPSELDELLNVEAYATFCEDRDH